MSAILKKSLMSGKQFVLRSIGATTEYTKGQVVLFNDLLAIALERGGGATQVAAARLLGILLPSEVTFIFEHECVTIPKALALVINVGDKVYWDVADGNVNKTASGNYECGYCVKAAASNDATVDIYFNGAKSSLTVVNGEVVSLQVSLTSAQVKALRASPIELVPTPGAGKSLEFCGATLLLDYGSNGFTESADNLAIKYTNGSGVIVSETIETTGFIDQTADTITNAIPKKDAIVAAASARNQALVLHNTGDGEIAGNAANDSVLKIDISYRIISFA